MLDLQRCSADGIHDCNTVISLVMIFLVTTCLCRFDAYIFDSSLFHRSSFVFKLLYNPPSMVVVMLPKITHTVMESLFLCSL
ncbi:hypothetical protein GDO78_001253 [Eleutherodactylus coqui]|uniref:Uncharacterized protein n=1 Tax=Eleutherodactylus coqui TaxID=57060 RepID=A0A8J6FT47_ELECQ|nr:hypothetical protein GDO78_001253 [Eleutherodactylus coqui]